MKKPTNALMNYVRCLLTKPTFRSPSATILRVDSIKEYNQKLRVANQFKI